MNTSLPPAEILEVINQKAKTTAAWNGIDTFCQSTFKLGMVAMYIYLRTKHLLKDEDQNKAI